ncbi:NUDIX hydrolase domain-like protein [Epithele typhae]|uniref:NUDIX hydrolase domain-like protein n=1 Tax=Epithele typhae TaxID=378194 RepID=UPI002007576C|nr:NUDIX hydrolase domain-like protein [Epithele typhae]KAH9941129.1 NUDIX hydrolase domain-like protein [Epithele typhae]
MSTLQLPPGLKHDGPLVEASCGGEPGPWLEHGKVKLYTNAFVIINDARILLGYKKRGFGAGLWNGFGGKVDAGETSAQAAVRELEEEAGITAPLAHCGTLFFVLEGSEHAFHIDIFRADEFTGDVTESEEMRPQWHAIQDALFPLHTRRAVSAEAAAGAAGLPEIPLTNMWPDDKHWLPIMFARRRFVGRADFAADGRMYKWWFAAEPPVAAAGADEA